MDSLRRLSTSMGILLLLFVLPDRPALAQSPIHFNAEKHLDGFMEAFFSEYSDLYNFAIFESRNGAAMSEAELAKIRAEWNREQARVEKEIRRIENDPVERTLHRMDRQLRRHPFFSRISFDRESAFTPVVLYMQRPQKAPAGYQERLLERYGPALKNLVGVFAREYAEPLGLAPREGHEAFILFILSSYGEYVNYFRAVSGRGFHTYGVTYDPMLRISVTYEDAFGRSGGREKERRRAAGYGLIHALLQAHTAYAKPPSTSAWIFEGLAELLSRSLGEDEETPPGALSETALQDFSNVLRDPIQRSAYFLRVDELMEIRNPSDLLTRIEPRADPLGDKDWAYRAREIFQKEAAFFIYFLKEAGPTEYRAPFTAFLETALKEHGARATESTAFQGLDPEILHKEFVAFLDREIRTHCPAFALKEEVVEAMANQPSGAGREKRRTAAGIQTGPAKPSPSVLDPGFDPGVLAPGAAPSGAALGWALAEARAGRLEPALHRIDGILASSLEATEAERVRRERNRLQALDDLRESFLEEVVRSGKRLRIEHGGDQYVGDLRVNKDGTLTLLRRGEEIATFPKEALEPEELVRRLREKRLDLGGDWITGYIYLITGNDSWERYLGGGGPEAESLVKDGPGILELLATGEAYQTLEELARTPLPRNSGEAQAILERIGNLLSRSGGLSVVRHHEKNLLQMAAHAYARIFDETDLKETVSLQGRLERRADGTVRLAYAFDEESELQDFEACEYLEEDREELASIQSGVEETFLEIQKGGLTCRGAGCWRLPFGLRAPLKLSYKIFFSAKGFEKEEYLPQGTIRLGFCDDGYGSCIQCAETGALFAHHKKSKFYEEAYPESSYSSNTRYQMEVVHDGKKVEAYRDGELQTSVPCGPLQSGGFFLWVHYDVISRIYDLELEGTPDPAYLARLRDDWIRGKLEALREGGKTEPIDKEEERP